MNDEKKTDPPLAKAPTVSEAGQASAPETLRPAEVIGAYRLLQRLGAGGMGEVWEAEQSEPVRRRVALELIKPGMDSLNRPGFLGEAPC